MERIAKSAKVQLYLEYIFSNGKSEKQEPPTPINLFIFNFRYRLSEARKNTPTEDPAAK